MTSSTSTRHIVISGTNFWNPGDDFVRQGVVNVLRNLFAGDQLNFLFYNFNPDNLSSSKASVVGNVVSRGDLERCRDEIDAVIIAGLSAGDEVNELYQWVIDNGLQDRVYLIGAGYENDYVAAHIEREPAATIFRNARLVTGRTARKPGFIEAHGIPYAHIQCPAILSVPAVRDVPAGKQIERIGFSIQLPHGDGLVNQTCDRAMYQLAVDVLRALAGTHAVEVVAHHKTEYFHFLQLLRGTGIPVVFSSFFEDLFAVYPRYDLVVTTRLHASLFANGHGVPGIILNDTDRHTHTLDGFPHSVWVNNRAAFDAALRAAQCRDLRVVAEEAVAFKRDLMQRYLEALSGPMCIHRGAAYAFDSEQREQALVRRLVRPGMTVLDVGANIGKYTKLFSLLAGKTGRVFAFEPCHASYVKLAGCVASDALANVRLHEAAVDRAEGTVTLHQFPDEYSSWNSLGEPRMEDPRDHDKLVPLVSRADVTAVTLDAFCRREGIDRIDYLKLDVEGAEIRALEGASDLLRRQAIRHLQFEVSRQMLEGLNTTARAVFDFLAQHGYTCHAITDRGAIGAQATDSTEFYANYIAVPAARDTSLPVHFLTIVLNGKPFIEHHLAVFRQLPYRWHWHVVEGVAELAHDTAWSQPLGGRITDTMHRNGLSRDGTTDYLDEIARQFPDNITVYRQPNGARWDGKRAMVNRPLDNIREECLLWQVDADELWTVEQLVRGRDLFRAHSERTAAFFRCHYFVGPGLVTTTRDTYGNNTGYEWLRAWRFTPGCRWTAHEPPRLCRPDAKGNLVDLASIQPFRHDETEAAGLVFQHYAYAVEHQLRFKEQYYGYSDAVAQWERLQQAASFPAKLRDYFSWVTDAAEVNTIAAQGITPLAKLNPFGGWQFTAHSPASLPAPVAVPDPERILVVRTDAIGDGVLAGAMWPHLRDRYPRARIGVLCRSTSSDLYRACPQFDEVIAFDHFKAFTEEVYREDVIARVGQFQADLVLNTMYSREPLTELLILSHRPANIIGMAGDNANLNETDKRHCDPLYTKLIESPGAHKGELDRHKDFLAGIGVAVDRLQPQVWTTGADESFAECTIAEHGLDPSRTIALCPGAKHAWRVYSRYDEALAHLDGYRIVLLGGDDTREMARQMTAVFGDRCVNLTGQTTLQQTAAILRRCRLYVGAESSGAHIADAVGTASVVVIGGGHFGRFMPYSPRQSLACLPMDCFGCNWVCKHETHPCVREVPVNVIRTAIDEALAGASDKPRVYFPSSTSAPAGWLRADVVHFKPVEVTSPVSTVSPSADILVTAIVSTCNAERFIRGCLDNLVAQTIFNRMEVIVVDSGSEQNERAIVEEYRRRHPNIVYLRTGRETLPAAWNRGIDLARGRYVVNANTDDAHRLDAFERLAATLDSQPDADLAYADTAWTSTPHDAFPSSRVIRTVRYPAFDPAHTLFYCPTGCQQFWRKTVFDRIGKFDPALRAVADYELVLRLVKSGGRAVRVPEVLSLFFQNTTGITQGSTVSQNEENTVRAQYRDEMPIERCYAVDPSDTKAVAGAWVLLGKTASACPVPWLDEPVRDDSFALCCIEKAAVLDGSEPQTIHDLVVLLHRCGRGNEIGPWLGRLDPAWVERVHRSLQLDRKPVVTQTVAITANVKLPVRWCGPVFNPSGYASEAINFLVPLASRLNLGLFHHNNLYSEKFVNGLPDRERAQLFALRDRFSDLAGGIVISHNPANGLMRLPDAHYSIGRTMFETDRIPKDWITACNQMDEIWVPSQFNVETFAAAGVERDKLVVMPEAVDTHEFDPARHEPLPLPNRAKYNFLAIFEWSSRKAWDVLIAAYLREFSASDDVCLYLRTYLFSQPDGDPKEAIWQMIREHAATLGLGDKPWPRIEVLAEQVPLAQLPRLYKAADCLVAPSRGEGWGRPHHEAMLMELPVIATNWSGNTEFMNNDVAYMLDYEMQDITHIEPELWHYRGHRWANPSESHLRQTMRHVQQHPDEARAKGKAARAHMVATYSRDRVADLVVQRLAVIERNLSTANLPACRSITPVVVAANNQPVRIAWEGAGDNAGSLGHVNREITRQLARQPKVSIKSDRSDVTVRHQWPPDWSKPKHGLWVIMQPWEYGHVPGEWVQKLVNVDEVWTPSAYSRRTFVDAGVAPSKVKIVPNGIDPDRFKPDAAPLTLATRKTFKFLFVGGTIHRKGADVLLRSYLDTFTASDDVCLVIKDVGGNSFYAGQTMADEIRAAQSKPNAPEILYLTDDLKADEIPGLYTACDCLVHPYRGEGFGLPVLEAMACGLPVIVTGGGATDDFVDDQTGYRISARRKQLGWRVGNMPLNGPGWLLEPEEVSLAASLQWVNSHRDEARSKGRVASERVRRDWTWERAAQVAANRARDLVSRQQADDEATRQRRARKSAGITVPAVARLGQITGKHDPVSVRAALDVRPFNPDAQKLCTGAGHAEPRLTVCLITKNEERFIGKCLESVRDIAWQIVVADTGSTDRTKQIATEHGAEVHEVAWTDDFSAARNAALEHARGDWVLVLDADEELTAQGRQSLRAEMREKKVMAYRLPIVDAGKEDEGCSYVPRLFRNAPGLFYVGRIHEQIFSSIEVLRKKWGLENRLSKATLLHHGYTAEMTKSRRKNARNLQLLQKALEEFPNEPNLLMNFGLELVRAGRLEQGLEQYLEAFHLMSAQPTRDVPPELREALLTQLCAHLMTGKRFDLILDVLDSKLARDHGLTASLHFARGLSHMELKQLPKAVEDFRRCIAKRDEPVLCPVNKDVRGAGPHHCLAIALYKLERYEEAGAAFEAAIMVDPTSRKARFDYAVFLSERGFTVDALKLLHRLVSEKADEIAVWMLGGRIALSQPEFAEFAADWTGEAIKLFPQDKLLQTQRAVALTWQALRTGDTLPAVVTDIEAKVSAEFLKLYRRALAQGDAAVTRAVTTRLPELTKALPGAGKVLTVAVAAAGNDHAAAAAIAIPA